MSKFKLLPNQGDTLDPRGLLSRYIFALGLILLLIVSSHLAAVSTVSNIKRSNEVISESANQKARVARIQSFAEMAAKLRVEASSDRINAEINELERVHKMLVATARHSAALREPYLHGGRGPALDPVMRKFIADARIVAALETRSEDAQAALQRIRIASNRILPAALQEANEAHQHDAKNHSNDLTAVQNVTFILALLVLLVEAVFIFIPAHYAVRRAIDQLSAKTQNLSDAHQQVEQRNEELEQLRATAEHDSLHDSLTGLANRRSFEREIERLSAEAHETGGSVTVLHIDLDRFKEINDALGHAAGDYVLRHVGDVLRDTAAGDDFVARIGGDEFVIVRSGQRDRRELEAVATRVIELLSQPIRYHGELCQFGASVGIGVGIACESGSSIDPSRLIANADIALYRAKEMGRGRFEFFSETLRREVEEYKTLSDELAMALRREEFFPVYQPQFDAVTGRICGVEALARWRHPERGEVSPGVFIPIAERLRYMGLIDQAIFEKSIEDLEAWDALGLDVPTLSLNISSARLRDPNLAAFLTSNAHPQGRLVFEVVETMFSDRFDDSARHALDLFEELDVKVEIDDFGTGHASLLSLLSLNPSRLKIARELVAPLPHSPSHMKLVAAICEIASSLGIAVTAEGVETEEQRELLTKLGCDRFQGFLFARPMPAEAFVELVSKTNGTQALSA